MARCLQCAAKLPRSAKFCPRCGAESVGNVGLPWAGIGFVLAVLFAPIAVILGWYLGATPLIWTGIVAAAALLLVVALAHFL